MSTYNKDIIIYYILTMNQLNNNIYELVLNNYASNFNVYNV